MTQSKALSALLFLNRFQFLYYSQGSTQSLPFQFTPEVVRDLEVVNKELLKEQLKAFIWQNNIKPALLTILLADDILFTKIMTAADQKTREDETQIFVETVPFEETSMIQIPFEQSNIIAVANQDYFQAFQEGFEALGFSTELVLPAFLMSKEVNLAKSADPASLSVALKRAVALKQYDMQEKKIALQQATAPSFTTYSTTPQTAQDRKRLFLLGGVFGVLILVLIAVFLWSQSAS